MLDERDAVIPEDVQAVLPGVTSHRLQPVGEFSKQDSDATSLSLQSMDELMAEVLDEWQLLRPTAQYIYSPCDSEGSSPDSPSNKGAEGLGRAKRGAPGGDSLPTPSINVDVTLRAALMNLLNNAADASPRAIEIYTRRDDSNFILEIHDHGAGLSAEAALKAGSAFFSTKTAGRGLGLFLANATIERMGGTVRLFNRELGGATTVLTLPIISSLK